MLKAEGRYPKGQRGYTAFHREKFVYISRISLCGIRAGVDNVHAAIRGGTRKYLSIFYHLMEELIMPFVNNNQREGYSSNSFAGNEFEKLAWEYFKSHENIELERNYSVDVGLSIQKPHRFDLGNSNTLIECKSHTWTNGGNVPSAKLSVWNEAMYYFHVAPSNYKKILFVQMDFSQKHCITLLQYYLQTFYHFIPNDVLFYDYYLQDRHCDIYRFSDIERILERRK